MIPPSPAYDISSQDLLQGVAIATNQLLVIEDDHDAVQQALITLGRTTQADRIYVFENHPHPETGEPAISQQWEWVAPGITPELDNPAMQNMVWAEMLPRWHKTFLNKQVIAGLIKDFPDDEQAFLESQAIQSILVVPMRVRDTFWGVIGFDDCRRERVWSDIEKAALMALGGTLGGAIIQRRTDVKLKQLNQDLEQRVRDRTEELRQEKEKAESHSRELEQTLQQLQQAQAQLIRSEKMSALGQLVAGIAHEINNPLNFINGNIRYAAEYIGDVMDIVDLYGQLYPETPSAMQQLQKDVDFEFIKQDLPEMFSGMQMGAQRIISIVRSLKTFSRLDDSQWLVTDLHAELNDTLTILNPRLSGRNPVQVVKDYGTLPAIECSPVQIGQVFMNLISNAIDSLEEKQNKLRNLQIKSQTQLDNDFKEDLQRDIEPPIIRIQTQALDGAIVVMISDNGMGIDDETQTQMFNPFFTTKEVGKGTGLGLSIVHEIVTQKHHGAIDCISTPGQGTTFTLTFPLNSPLPKT